jgi:hypothetical protein
LQYQLSHLEIIVWGFSLMILLNEFLYKNNLLPLENGGQIFLLLLAGFI